MRPAGFRVVKYLDLSDLVTMIFWLATVKQTYTLRGEYAVIYFDCEEDAISFKLRFGGSTEGPEYLDDY